MKLKCDAHGRRVITIPGKTKFIHRNGDGSECLSRTATIGDKSINPLEPVGPRDVRDGS